MSIYNINAETLGKCKKKINLEKKYTSQANEFLLETVEAIGKFKRNKNMILV